MDIRPVTPGHLLVVPNDHVVAFVDVPAETMVEHFAAARILAGALRASDIPADGINTFVADGEAAGQEVWHAHVHVIPRFTGDGFRITADAWRGRQPERPELDALADQIRAHVHS